MDEEELNYLLAARFIFAVRPEPFYKTSQILRNLGVLWYMNCYDTPRPTTLFDIVFCVACGSIHRNISSSLATYGCRECERVPESLNDVARANFITSAAHHIPGYQFRRMQDAMRKSINPSRNESEELYHEW